MAIACPICGSANQEGAGRCLKCGAPLPIMDLPEVISRENSGTPAPGRSGPVAGGSVTPPLVEPPTERGDEDTSGRIEQGPLRRTVFRDLPPSSPPEPVPPPAADFEPPPPELEVGPAVSPEPRAPKPEPGVESAVQFEAGARQEEEPAASGPDQYQAGGAPAQEWAAQQWPWAYQAYGAPGVAGVYPWMFPYPVMGYYSPAFGFLPCLYPQVYPQLAMPCYGTVPYGQQGQSPATAEYPAQQSARAAPKRGQRGLLITLLVIFVLVIVAGGAVAAYFLLRGESKKSFNLGDAKAVGADVEFRDMVLRKDGDVMTLSGKYDNNTESEGDAVITVQAIGNAGTTRVAFTVPVEAGTDRSFTEQSAMGPMKLSGATLGSIVFESREEYDSGETDGQSSAPWETDEPVEESVPSEEGQTVPDMSSPEYRDFLEQSVPGQSGSLPP